MLSETWLTESNMNYCEIEGYISFHMIRNTGKSGGFSIFCGKQVKSRKMDILSISDKSKENCCVSDNWDI